MKPLYLDNAATTHPKPESVYLAVMDALRSGGSPGRGVHNQAIAADRLVFETREALAELFNADNSDRFIFTENATSAINLALFGLLQSGDCIVTTSMEHNAVVRPLKELQKRGVNIVKVSADPMTGIVERADLQEACLQQKTRLLLVNHCSNVFGSIQPVSELGEWCQKHGIVFMLDGAQSAGSIPIDFKALQVDLFAAPGHKGLLGPQGTGFLYIGGGVELSPFVFGGTGADSQSPYQPKNLPERFESGTMNLPGLAGLYAALQFLQKRGVDEIRKHEVTLISKIVTGLKGMKSVNLYGTDNVMLRSNAISFNLVDRDPAEIGYFLDQQEQIRVRVGLHCAPDAHRTMGTFPAGTVRVSPGLFNTEEEIDRFLQVMHVLAHESHC